ncbi:MAG: radical SAM protein [Bacteroidales bacterium]|jgi:radical SAM superfamily enzyme YgiQ (UPF0313 family)
MKILLIEPPLRYSDDRLPLGLLYISAYLKKYDYDHQLITSSLLNKQELSSFDIIHIGNKKILEIVKKEMPDIIGVSVLLSEQKYVIDLSKEIKKIIPDVLLVIGGPQPSTIPEVFFQDTIDLIVIGEGEQTFVEIVNNYQNGKPLFDIPGIFYRNKDGQFIKTSNRSFIMDLDDIGFPNYEYADQRKLQNINYNFIRGVPLSSAYILSARGCPFGCYFCGGKKILGTRIRYRSVDSIKEEIEYLRAAYCIESIYFIDDTFTANYDRVSQVCMLMKQFDIPWGCQPTVNTLNVDMVKLLSDSGCIQVDLGIESGSGRILKQMNKQYDLEKLPSVFKLCRLKKLRTYANFIIGFPSETYQEMMKTLRLAKRIKPDMCDVWILTPLPGTKLWEKYNFNINPDELYKLGFNTAKILRSSNLSEVGNLFKVRQLFYSRLSIIILFRLLLNLSFAFKLIIGRPRKFIRTYYYIRFSYRMFKHTLRYPVKVILNKY